MLEDVIMGRGLRWACMMVGFLLLARGRLV